MRLVPVLLATLAVPALAAAEPAKAPPSQPSPQEVAEIQKTIADPATGAAIGRMMPALSKALMNMPVGELEAAMEGRAPTAADKTRTVRDSMGSPEEAARVERDLAASGPQMQAMQKALAAALPGMIAAAGVMQQEMEKATATLPQPEPQRR